MQNEKYEAVIGLEVHAQLHTRSKLFCACATTFGAPPNTHTCPTCLGLPGALPVLNQRAVELAARVGTALGCELHRRSIFARKNYFYPDLPKGYQISQYDKPIAEGGSVVVSTKHGDREVRIRRVHMEEDAGKSVHTRGTDSIVDLNRAGTPLVEIVSEPDLRHAEEASEYLRDLREILMLIGACDGNMEQGSLRCDANVSIRPRGSTELGERTELKNINSFRFVEEAVALEIRRQIEVVEGGGSIRPQTRGYNSDKRETYVLRDKEGEADYRYFPEPDLPPLVLSEDLCKGARDAVGELPKQKRRRYVEELGLTEKAAEVLTGHPEIAAYFERAVELGGKRTPTVSATKIGNFIQSEVLRDTSTSGLDAQFPTSAENVAELLGLVEEGRISTKQSKEVLGLLLESDGSPSAIIEQRGMAVVSDVSAIEDAARTILNDNPKQVETYRGGKTNVLGFFVGQLMKKTKGSANPKVANEVLKKLLDG